MYKNNKYKKQRIQQKKYENYTYKNKKKHINLVYRKK